MASGHWRREGHARRAALSFLVRWQRFACRHMFDGDALRRLFYSMPAIAPLIERVSEKFSPPRTPSAFREISWLSSFGIARHAFALRFRDVDTSFQFSLQMRERQPKTGLFSPPSSHFRYSALSVIAALYFFFFVFSSNSFLSYCAFM